MNNMKKVFRTTLFTSILFWQSCVPAGAQDTSISYSYDALGRLVGVAKLGGTADGDGTTYEFDAASNRKRVTAVTLADGQTWTFCSAERSTCTLNGLSGDQFSMRYGDAPNWTYKRFTLTGTNLQVSCSNDAFADPAVGRVKHCDIVPYFAAGWQNCAPENGTCTISGGTNQKWIVRYGADSKWSASQTVTPASGNTSLPCNNTQFGDPYPGVVKSCERQRIQ